MPESNRLTVQARCGSCDWIIEFTGDDVADVAPSIDKLAIAHIAERHPENANHPPRMIVLGAVGA